MPMIYSSDVEKICALCRNSHPAAGAEEHLKCSVRNEYVPLRGGCADFEYDIFKKPTHRKHRLKDKMKDFNINDFRL